MIIALGESLIVAAAGLTGAPRVPELIAVGMLAVALTCGLWWSYFPYVKPRLEAALHAAGGVQRTQMARDTFSLTHFPMLCGVIGLAASFEEAIAHPADPLATEGRIALAAGLALFLGSTAVACWRAGGSFPAARLGAVVATATVIVLWTSMPAWASLAVGLAGVTLVVTWEQHALVERPSPAGEGSPSIEA